MTVRIEGHDCMLFADRDRQVLPLLSFRGKVRWFEFRIRAMLLRQLENLRPPHRGRTEEALQSLLAFGTLLFNGVEALGGFYRGKDGSKQTFRDFIHDFMGSAYAPYSHHLRDHFRNGLAHGFVVKNGAFEFFSGSGVRPVSGGGVQIDPDRLFRDFKRAIRVYLKQLRADGPGSRIGGDFLKRFNKVFGV